MEPFIHDNDILEVAPVIGKHIQIGDVVLVESSEKSLLAHRVFKMTKDKHNTKFLIKSDNSTLADGWYRLENILGRVDIVERNGLRIKFTSPANQLKSWVWVTASPLVLKFSWIPLRLRRYLRDCLLMK